jgi:hypothetical protein
MTSYSQQVKQSVLHSGAPGWRPLTALVALVLAAHALILQASPAQRGISPSADDTGAKTPTTFTTFSTRSIETAPTPAVAATAIAAPVATPKAVKTTQNRLKNPIIQTTDHRIQAPAQTPEPTEAVVIAEPVPILPPEAEAAVEISTASTPIETVAAPPAAPQTKPVTAIRLPGSARLEYKVSGLSKNLNYHANAELSWKTDGDSYQAMMKVSAFLIGSRSMTSVGKITSSGLAPTRFADKYRSELAAHFEPEKGKVSFSANTPDAPWVEGVQDRVSVFFQLGGMLAAKPQDFPPGSSITFLTIGPREADTWTFVIEPEEKLDLMGAPMAALKLTRKPRKEFDQKVEIWFAPSLGYLPVRNRITQPSGDFIDQQLTDVVN